MDGCLGVPPAGRAQGPRWTGRDGWLETARAHFPHLRRLGAPDQDARAWCRGNPFRPHGWWPLWVLAAGTVGTVGMAGTLRVSFLRALTPARGVPSTGPTSCRPSGIRCQPGSSAAREPSAPGRGPRVTETSGGTLGCQLCGSVWSLQPSEGPSAPGVGWGRRPTSLSRLCFRVVPRFYRKNVLLTANCRHLTRARELSVCTLNVMFELKNWAGGCDIPASRPEGRVCADVPHLARPEEAAFSRVPAGSVLSAGAGLPGWGPVMSAAGDTAFPWEERTGISAPLGIPVAWDAGPVYGGGGCAGGCPG